MDPRNLFDEWSVVIVFHLDDQRFALPLAIVDRAVRMQEITPLPKAPEIVLGIINIRGTIIPVYDIRRRFRLPWREPGLNDRLLLARTRMRLVALAVDVVDSSRKLSEAEMVEIQTALSGTDYVQGILKLKEGLVLVADLDRFLDSDEEKGLAEALSA